MILAERWLALDPAWRFAVITFLAGRIALSIWAFVVTAAIPLAVANLDLHGEPVVTAFDLRTSARAVFSRMLDGKELHFRAAFPNFIDAETNTVWDLNGRALSGERAGAQLSGSKYSVEEVMPYRGVAAEQNGLLAPWQRFDANWYLKIAEHGYGDDGSTVYFPLYPLLIRVIGLGLLGNGLLGAILISNASLIGALCLLYKFAADLNGDGDAKRALAFFMLFPTAFFLFAPYTESLFTLCALASLRAGQRSGWFLAGVWGALGALTRLQGVLMIVPLAYLLWRRMRNARDFQASARFLFYDWRFAPLLFIPFATIAFFVFTNLPLVNTYESQLHARFVLPWDNVLAALTNVFNARASVVDILNLLCMPLFGVMVGMIWLKLPHEYGLYSAAMFLAPLLRMTTEQPLVSMMRYSLLIFPVFILWGKWGANAWARRIIVYLSVPLQLFLSAQSVLWGWVA